MNNVNNVYFENGINQMMLRIIGIVFMVFGSSAYVLTDYPYLACCAWVSYPIFAFILADGFEHTTSKLKYALRILLFAIISEPLYDLLVSNNVFSMDQQSVMFTLLVSFIAMCIVDAVRNKADNMFLTLLLVVLTSFVAIKVCNALHTQFAQFGVVFVFLFYLSEKVSYPKLLQIATVLYISFFISKDVIATLSIASVQYELTIQLFAFISLIAIWFYNGERGPNRLGLKMLIYLIYPIHFVLVYMISLL